MKNLILLAFVLSSTSALAEDMLYCSGERDGKRVFVNIDTTSEVSHLRFVAGGFKNEIDYANYSSFNTWKRTNSSDVFSSNGEFLLTVDFTRLANPESIPVRAWSGNKVKAYSTAYYGQLKLYNNSTTTVTCGYEVDKFWKSL